MGTLTERRRFGRTGLEVSPLGFGGAPIGYLETDADRTRKTLHTLLDAGVNLIDTAAMYRGSEALIGQTVSDRRDEFVLVSKCGTPLPDVDHDAWTPELVTASVDRSLRALKTDCVDVMLLHTCELEVLERGECLGALARAKEAGKVRHVGYSGDNETALAAARMPEIEVLQTSVNICDQRNIDIVLAEAWKREVGVMAKRPIANAAWKDPEDQRGIYTDYSRVYHERFGRMGLARDSFDQSLGNWASIALRFTLSHPVVSTAIIGTTNPDNALANCEAAAEGVLPDAAYRLLREAFTRAQGTETWQARG